MAKEKNTTYRVPANVLEAGRRILSYAMKGAQNNITDRQILFGILVEASAWVSLTEPDSHHQPESDEKDRMVGIA